MTDDERPIMSDLAWRILERLAEGSLDGQQMADEFPLPEAALQELIENGFISQEAKVQIH